MTAGLNTGVHINTDRMTHKIPKARFCPKPIIILVLLSFFPFSNGRAAEYQAYYMRMGAGTTSSQSTAFADVACDSASGLALFGCAEGNDGRPIGAYGDFGDSTVLDFAIGYRWNRWFTMELVLTDRSGFRFDGRSNFSQLDPAVDQVVIGEAKSSSLMLSGVVHPLVMFGRESRRFDPFVSGGVGVARNRMKAMVYSFPATRTITPDGHYAGYSWSVGAGFRYALHHNIQLEFRYRFADLGTVGTDAGTMTIRSQSTGDIISDTIVINGTKADLTVREALLSILWSF